MTLSDPQLWMIIVILGICTFFIRLSFLGLVGKKEMPEWVLRHLRYTPVAIIPGLIAPIVIWPDATGGEFDLPRFVAALATLGAAYWTKNLFAGIFAGAFTLAIMLQLA